MGYTSSTSSNPTEFLTVQVLGAEQKHIPSGRKQVDRCYFNTWMLNVMDECVHLQVRC
jgi:hypothetical protein